ncbi:MAG: phospholipid carrier-dependent glycosyltransferase [Planctomycetes bacterium]|nr:phospholipid carrier-dependent glycosyltransferase [Planctomycetota bacterium]
MSVPISLAASQRRARYVRAHRWLAAHEFLPVLALLLLVLLFFFQIGARDLISSHEARAAQNAQRMLDTGAWGLPVLYDGQRDLQKPPGYYWLVAAAGALNGGYVSPLVARLPAALAAVAVVLLVYGFLRREGYATGALVAAVALATANHFVAIGRTARIDVPLTCAVAVALVCFYRAATREAASGYTVASGFAVGVAILLKGPIGLALVGAVAVAFLIVERIRLPLTTALLGTSIVALVAGPWFVWANHETGGAFVRVFFWHHNVARFMGESEVLAAHPWWYYGPRGTFAFLPWTLPLVPLMVWAAHAGLWRESRPFRFGVVWCVVMIAVLSASRFKRADYLLPALPGAAIALGCTAQHWLASRERARSVRLAKWAFGALAFGALAVWPVMWFVVEPAEAARQEKKPFAEAIRAHAPAPQTVVLFRTESHLLAYHLGPPLRTLVEWGDLRDALAPAGPHTVVMPPEFVAEAARLTGRKLVPVADLADFVPVRPPRPLVCLRTEE